MLLLASIGLSFWVQIVVAQKNSRIFKLIFLFSTQHKKTTNHQIKRNKFCHKKRLAKARARQSCCEAKENRLSSQTLINNNHAHRLYEATNNLKIVDDNVRIAVERILFSMIEKV